MVTSATLKMAMVERRSVCVEKISADADNDGIDQENDEADVQLREIRNHLRQQVCPPCARTVPEHQPDSTTNEHPASNRTHRRIKRKMVGS